MSSVVRGREWRELVSLALRAELIEGSRPKRTRRPGERLGAVLAEPEEPLGDVLGIENWTVATRAARERRIPGDLFEVENDAKRNGDEFAAVIYSGPVMHEYENAVVTMSFSNFARLLRDRS